MTSYTSPAGTTTHYTYDASGLRATSATSGSSITDHDTWDRASTVPLLLSDGPHKFIYGPGGVPIEQITTSTAAVTYLHTDQAGSVRLLTDTSGTVTGTYSYDPWGQTTAHTGTGTTPLGYDGQYTDPESGLIYLRARYYDPQTAQFLTLDPAVAVTGQPYNYTGNDPLNAADPTGLGCGVFNPGDCFHDVAHGAATAWNDTLGGHWRGVAQVATVVGTALGTAACIEATAGLCAAALPEIGGLTGMALYAESGGPHTAEGYTKAFAEGGIAGSLGLVCTAVCGLAGNVLVVSGIVNGLVGAGQGMWDYSTNGDCSHNAGGYLSSGAEGFAQ
ncbi:MAG TPA: RHS repeat-associated core domain-containing protein, partial [Nocardioides sp.]|nr:RHS repeat-associated core domain-containing protein [Nocardioides sp.]